MLGDKIKEIRKSRKMSQVEFGKILNVSKQSVCNWENNNIPPSVDILKEIAVKFSVTTDYLLEIDQRYIVDVSDLPFEIVAHLQQVINDLKKIN